MRVYGWLLLVLTCSVVSTLAIRLSRADEHYTAIHLALDAQDDTSGNDLAVALGMYIRKFNVALPEGVTSVKISLANRTGRTDVNLGNNLQRDVKNGEPRSLLVSVQPIEGTIDDADKLKFTVAGFGSVTSATIVNPWKNLAMVFPSDPESDGDGEFALIGVYNKEIRKGPIAKADQVLRLKICAVLK